MGDHLAGRWAPGSRKGQRLGFYTVHRLLMAEVSMMIDRGLQHRTQHTAKDFLAPRLASESTNTLSVHCGDSSTIHLPLGSPGGTQVVATGMERRSPSHRKCALPLRSSAKYPRFPNRTSLSPPGLAVEGDPSSTSNAPVRIAPANCDCLGKSPWRDIMPRTPPSPLNFPCQPSTEYITSLEHLEVSLCSCEHYILSPHTSWTLTLPLDSTNLRVHAPEPFTPFSPSTSTVNRQITYELYS
jgi:hypothetical protein